MIAPVVGHFGLLRLELQDVFEMQIVDAVLDGEPEDVGVVVAFHLFLRSRGERGECVGGRREE